MRWPARLRKPLLASAALLVVVTCVVIPFTTSLAPDLRERVIDELSERLESRVELSAFSVSVFPRPVVRGEGLVVRHRGRTDVPPLISIRSFSVETGLWGLYSGHVRRVHVDGLELRIPPKNQRGESFTVSKRSRWRRIVIDEILSHDAQLQLLPKRPDKLPHVFQIHDLSLRSVGRGLPMSFRATLNNPKPEGLIETSGEFGPWQRAEPGLTPVSGNYVFSNANLATFKGIAGILSSKGKFSGVLERIQVQGETHTPDFRVVSTGGHPVALNTRFQAVVDGTNGDTLLQPVRATFQRTGIVATGGVIKKPRIKGHTIALDVTVGAGRVEDLLYLASKAKKPPMTGAVDVRTKFKLPPGEADVVERLNLDGEFAIRAARFTDLDVQERIESLSRRGRGKPKQVTTDNVVSNLKGRFVLRRGVLNFSNLTFSVAGASVQLTGRYDLRSEELDFRGTLRLAATLSQTTTGVKSVFLKLFDPFFRRKNAGTVLPIKIIGTREKPSFGLDVRSLLHRSD